MTVKVYAVTLHVNERNLGTVLGALAGSSSLVSVVPTVETAGKKDPATKQHFFRDGKRNKGISGKDLLVEILSSSNRVFDLHEIAQGFVNRGFARNSCSPQLAYLSKDGTIRALGNGKYCMPGVTVKI